MNLRILPLLTSILIFSNFILAQEQCVQQQPPLREYSELELMQLTTLPVLKVPANHAIRDLPAVVDNSTQPYMRPVFQQDQYCCGQASSVAYNFTYEIARERNIPANVPQNQYPTHFSWNFANGGNGWFGVSALESIRILKEYGMPNVVDYGGTLSYGGPTRWMSGYAQWFNGMHNRITEGYQLQVGDPEGLLVFKSWLYDHLEGSSVGGLASFYAQHMSATNTLPAGTPEAGKYVLTYFGGSANHTMTIVGYNDSIRWDYNGDGQYTNNIDINGDGQVTMKDWEIGGFKMVQSYGGVPNWGNQGYAYMMYKTVADNLGQGGIWNHTVIVLDVKETCDPKLTARIQLKHTNRSRIKVLTGVASNPNATLPEEIVGYNMFDYQGGNFYMQGGSTEADKTIEFGLDLSPFLSGIPLNQNVKIFLQVVENDASGSYPGEVIHFSIYDHTAGGVEIVCPQSNVTLVNNDTTTLSITRAFSFDRIQILDETLPPAPYGQPYSYQMNAGGGTQPYWWQLDKSYTESTQTAQFPSTNAVQLNPSNNTSGWVTRPIDFEFPFYDSSFTSVTLHVDGYLMFDEQLYPYPYFIDDKTLFKITRNISPFMNQHQEISYSSGCGIWYEGDANSATFRWKTVQTEDPSKQYNYAVKLFPNGDIRFYYGTMTGCGDFLWLSGISDGNGNDHQQTAISNKPSVTANIMIQLDRYDYPEELVMEETGLLHGTPQSAYSGILMKVKVTDNSFIHTVKDFVLSSSGIIVQDSVSAGDDQTIAYGEEADLTVNLWNIESDTVPDAEMVIHISDPYITVTDSTESLGDLIPGQVNRFFDAFSFEVAENVPDNHLITIESVISSGAESWESSLFHYAYAPVVSAIDIAVADDNDRLDPGDTADVTITFLNEGGVEVESLFAVLSTSDPYITIHQNFGNIPLLLAGGTAELTYNLSVAENCPPGHQADFEIDLMGSGNYTASDSFSLVVGLYREDFETGDFNLFSWGCGGNRDWTIDTYSPQEGYFCAKSGAITHYEESVMMVDMDVLTAGEISFYKRVICENDTSVNNNFDYLSFRIDGIEQARWDGDSPWSLEHFAVPAGLHRFEWVYHKDNSVNFQMDAAWVDYIVFPSSLGASPGITASPAALDFLLRPGDIEQGTIHLSNTAGGLLEFTAYEAGIQPSRGQAGNRNIEGSYLVTGAEKFRPGEVYTWNFRTYNGGNDNEWIKQIYISFPNGLELTNATNFAGGSGGEMVFQGPLGNGVSAHWFGEDANGWGVVHMGELASADVTLYTHANVQEDVMLSYDVMGEVYGGPPHTVSGTIPLRNLGPEIPWMSLNDSTGMIPGNHSDSVVVTVDATGLEDGTYTAWVLLQDNFGHEITVPVTITVDQFLGIEGTLPKDNKIMIELYPNPSSGMTYFDITLSKPERVMIRISNAQGNEVRSINSPANATDLHLVFNGRDEAGNPLPPGLYLVKIFAGNQIASEKLLLVK